MNTKTLGKKQLRSLLVTLRDARRAATMETMSTSESAFIGDGPVKFKDGRPVTERGVDDYIREKTRIFRVTWVVDPLDDVIDALQKASEA